MRAGSGEAVEEMLDDGRGIGLAPDDHGLHGGQAGGQGTEDEAGAFDFGQGGGGGGDAEPSGDKPHLGLDVVGVLGGMHLGSDPGAGGEEGIVKAVLLAGVDHDEAFAIHVFPFQVALFGEAMAGGHGEHLVGLLGIDPFQFFTINRGAQDAHIQFASLQAAELFGAGLLEQGELHAGETVVKSAQDAGEARGGGGGDHAQPQDAGEAVMGFAGGLHGLGGGPEQSAGFLQQDTPGGGQAHGARRAFKQTDFHVGFQGFDLGAQSRLGQVQTFCRPAEVQFLGHGHKVSQLPQFHD